MRGGRGLVHTVALDGPVENEFMLKTASVEEILEKFPIFRVVWCFLKLKLSAMSHVLSEFLYKHN